jgi:hypothetical protein
LIYTVWYNIYNLTHKYTYGHIDMYWHIEHSDANLQRLPGGCSGGRHPASVLCYAILCSMLCYVVLCNTMLCYVQCYDVICYAMLCNDVPCYDMICYVLWYPMCYAMPCYAMLCCAILCYAMLCYDMTCYAMLCLEGWPYVHLPTERLSLQRPQPMTGQPPVRNHAYQWLSISICFCRMWLLHITAHRY